MNVDSGMTSGAAMLVNVAEGRQRSITHLQMRVETFQYRTGQTGVATLKDIVSSQYQFRLRTLKELCK